MKVWLYPERQQEEFGATRFEVSTEIVRPEAIGKDEIDHDDDIVSKHWGFKTKEQAEKFAAELLKRDDLAYGAITIQKQVVDWFVKEDRIAEWQDVGESEEVTA